MRISIFSILLFLFILPGLVYASDELIFAFTSDKALWIKTGELEYQIWEDCIDTEFTWSQVNDPRKHPKAKLYKVDLSSNRQYSITSPPNTLKIFFRIIYKKRACLVGFEQMV